MIGITYKISSSSLDIENKKLLNTLGTHHKSTRLGFGHEASHQAFYLYTHKNTGYSNLSETKSGFTSTYLQGMPNIAKWMVRGAT